MRYVAVLSTKKKKKKKKEKKKIDIEFQEDIRDELEEEVKRRQELEKLVNELEEEIERLRETITKLDSGEIQEELAAKEEELNRIKHDYALKMRNALALQRIKYEREIDNLKKEMRKLMMGKEELFREIKEREDYIERKEEELAEKEKSLDMVKVGDIKISGSDVEILRKMQGLLDEKDDALNELKKKIEDLERENESLKNELATVKRGSVAMMKYVTSLQQKKLEEELKDLKKALETEIEKRLQLEEQLKIKDEEIASYEEKMGKTMEELAKSNKMDLNLVKRLEDEIKRKSEELRKKEEAIRKKERELTEKLKGLEEEISKKIKKGTLLQDVKREFAAKEEELREMYAQLKKREEELEKREREILMRSAVPSSGGGSTALVEEIKRLREELKMKDEELKKLAEPIKYKEEEIIRREEELRLREEILKKEMRRIEDARAQGATIETAELRKQITELEEKLKAKEEEIKAKEKYLLNKEKQLKIMEASIVDKMIEHKAEELALEMKMQKAKTGTPRLDDLLYGGYPFGSNILVIGPPFIGKEVLVNCFIIESLQKGAPVLLITTDISPSEVRDELNYISPGIEEFEKKGLLKYVDVYSKNMGFEEEDNPNIIYVEHPTDYKGITRAMESISKEFMEKYRSYRLIVRSISTLVTYSDPTSTYRFLQMVTGRTKRAKAISLFLIDRGMHSETEIQTLGHLMDGSVELKTDGVKTFIAVQGICEVQSRAWIQYTYTRKGLNIGSFTLDHIR